METKVIGRKIATARKNINLSQAELAGQLFISPQALGKWERGESLPDLVMVSKLAKILGVDLNYFSKELLTVEKENDAARASIEQIVEPIYIETGNKIKWDMSRGHWADADFSGLKNLHEQFNSSNMQRCMFIGSELSGLQLKSNHVETCDFPGRT